MTTWTYKCFSCGKCFYIHSEAAEALGKLIDARCLLRQNGYNVENIVSPWEVVEHNAKCCEYPDVGGVFV